jgi:hypothetical protein
MDREEFDWNDMNEYVPEYRGHYLVAQKKGRDRCYRFVRFWEGEDWVNSKADEYGPVIYWMKMKPVPM